MQGQVVGAREAAAARDALEGFGSSVFPVVSGQLIGPGEAPVAVLPRAAVRLLSCSGHTEMEGWSPRLKHSNELDNINKECAHDVWNALNMEVL